MPLILACSDASLLGLNISKNRGASYPQHVPEGTEHVLSCTVRMPASLVLTYALTAQP